MTGEATGGYPTLPGPFLTIFEIFLAFSGTPGRNTRRGEK